MYTIKATISQNQCDLRTTNFCSTLYLFDTSGFCTTYFTQPSVACALYLTLLIKILNNDVILINKLILKM